MCVYIFILFFDLYFFSDCQDLQITFREQTSINNKPILNQTQCRFLPELRKETFASIDPRYSVMDGWDLKGAKLEFGNTDSYHSRSKREYATVILRLKMQRRWISYLYSIIFYQSGIAFLGCLTFMFDIEEPEGINERINVLVTLILTSIAFGYVITEKLPDVSYVTFIQTYNMITFLFLILLTIVSLSSKKLYGDNKTDTFFGLIMGGIYILYHIIFILIGYKKRINEKKKLFLGSDEISSSYDYKRPMLTFNYTKIQRTGKNKRFLSFNADINY